MGDRSTQALIVMDLFDVVWVGFHTAYMSLVSPFFNGIVKCVLTLREG